MVTGMTKEVLLAIKGLQFDGNSQEDLLTVLPAEYYERNGKHYVIYEETSEDSSQVTRSILKFRENELSVMRKGEVSVNLLFEKGKRNLASYYTPFGELMVGIYTGSMELTEKENELSLQVEYDLEMNYQHLAECRMSIELRPLQEGLEIFEK